MPIDSLDGARIIDAVIIGSYSYYWTWYVQSMLGNVKTATYPGFLEM